ncbi:MAG: peptidylprolyl isomerase [Duncaniella sp.]|nr:peptidylprolyl isomerase [Duncaniella sp.]
MKKILIAAALPAAILVAAAKSPESDPVLMTIGGKPVYQSEFEYLFNKNNAQQAEAQDRQTYLDLFTVYRLKVAEAEAERIDTTENFVKEFTAYRNDLSAPYLRDTTVIDRLVNEAYARMATRRRVSHIMADVSADPVENLTYRMRLDSIRNEIVNKGADFGKMAVKYSTDQTASRNRGNLGFLNPNTYPFPFEEAAWATPVGEISEVVDDTPYGFHIIRVEEEQPNPGSVEVRHILKTTRGMSPEMAKARKATIDSIYTLLKNGADFADLAARFSDDPGSAPKGGMLGKIGPGETVSSFEQTAFALADGEISEPIRSEYGYHIIQTLAHHPRKSLAEVRPSILRTIARDVRSTYPEKEFISKTQADNNIIVSPAVMKAVSEAVAKSGSAEEAFANIGAINMTVATLPDAEVSVADVMAAIPENERVSSPSPVLSFEAAAKKTVDKATKEYVIRRLMKENTSYRNLINEYRDGILLFDISNRRVWERAAADQEALEAYFQAHRADYSNWDRPRFKGFVVFAHNDSLAAEARTFLETNKVSGDSVIPALKDKFGRTVKAERVLTAKGDNAIVDEIAWGGQKAEPVGKWVVWFPYEWKIIDQPEEQADVKAAVTADYQQQLEQEWVNGLRKKFPVKYNKKNLGKLGVKVK